LLTTSPSFSSSLLLLLPPCLLRGQPYTYYCKLLSTLPSRELEQRDAALAAMRTPLWTVAKDRETLEFVVKSAK